MKGLAWPRLGHSHRRLSLEARSPNVCLIDIMRLMEMVCKHMIILHMLYLHLSYDQATAIDNPVLSCVVSKTSPCTEGQVYLCNLYRGYTVVPTV